MKARDPKNPFSFGDRHFMIENTGLTDAIAPLVDGTDDNWKLQVQEAVGSAWSQFYGEVKPKAGDIAIVGHFKDRSSSYLHWFPQWDLVNVDLLRMLDATTIRELIFTDYGDRESTQKLCMLQVQENCPASTCEFLEFFMKTQAFENLKHEYSIIKKGKDAWEAIKPPYPVQFMTVDAVVTCAGHVLMITRKHAPGKGLMALPGGFLNPGERVRDGIIRELFEETKIKLASGILRGNLKEIEFFDDPDRSLRGRTLTFAGHIPLQFGTLPELGDETKGDDLDDASRAIWVPFSEIKKNCELFFEDHFLILNHFIKF